MRVPFRFLSVVSVGLFAMPVFANSTGMVGNSGKNSNATCNSCHTGATAPTVTLTGPEALEPGATGQYTLTIKGGAGVVGGFNVAVDNAAATLQPIGSDERKEGGELTHSAPKSFSNGELRYDFSLVAPASGTVKIFGAGNSANKDGNSTKDRSSTATLSVTVNGSSGGGTIPEPEPKGGCSATGGASLSLLALAAASLLRRRRS